MNAQNIILAILLAVVGTMLALIYANMVKKDSNNKKAIKDLKNLVDKLDKPQKKKTNNLAPSPISTLNNGSNKKATNNKNKALNNLNKAVSSFSPQESLGTAGENFYGGSHYGGHGHGHGHGNFVEGFDNHPEAIPKEASNNSGQDIKKENEKLKKYLKIHGLYPENHAIDMSKYVLKTGVKSEKQCPDMSQYILKTSVPPQIKCPKINRDLYIAKTELPPNWNKECPAHPDLTNYVLKSTIPPNTKSQACICPKVTVNAGLCRKPSKDDCMAMKDVLQDACPKPEPCPEKKCPELTCPDPDPKVYIKRSELPPDWNKKCPDPPPPPPPCPRMPAPPPCPTPVCPTCPETVKQGKCPAPERCDPTKECPKCYDIKYIKTPVVKSEPLPKPDKETIFPANLIETKLVRQQTHPEPRQPRILKLEQNTRNNNLRDMVNDLNSNSNNNNLEEDDEIMNTQIDNNMVALAPSAMAIDNSSFINASPAMAPLYSPKNNKPKNLFNKVVEKIRNVGNNTEKANRQYPKELEGKCQKEDLNKMFNKFGTTGFNNQL